MDIKQAVEFYGVKNLRFFIPMKPIKMVPRGFFQVPMTDNKAFDVLTEFSILETRYRIVDNYKIQLQRVHRLHLNMPEGFSDVVNQETFYISDLDGLLRENRDLYQLHGLVDVPAQYKRLN